MNEEIKKIALIITNLDKEKNKYKSKLRRIMKENKQLQLNIS